MSKILFLKFFRLLNKGKNFNKKKSLEEKEMKMYYILYYTHNLKKITEALLMKRQKNF